MTTTTTYSCIFFFSCMYCIRIRTVRKTVREEESLPLSLSLSLSRVAAGVPRCWSPGDGGCSKNRFFLNLSSYQLAPGLRQLPPRNVHGVATSSVPGLYYPQYYYTQRLLLLLLLHHHSWSISEPKVMDGRIHVVDEGIFFGFGFLVCPFF